MTGAPEPSTTSAHCIHDMNPANCAFCSKPPPRPAAPFAQPSGLGPWITAQFPGECSGTCDAVTFEPGERIRTDGQYGWLCTDCGSEDRL